MDIFASVLIIIVVLFCIALFIFCLWYLFFCPIYIAERFPIWNDNTVNCIISYIVTWTMGLPGNMLYIILSLIIKNSDNKN